MEGHFIFGIIFCLIFAITECSDNGDITKIQTKGASAQTAKQDGLKVTGVEASHKLAQNDLERMNKYKDVIKKVAKAHDIDPALIAAIISRESRAGSPGVLKDGLGDNGNGFGLMQVDKRYHKPVGKWDSEEHISQGTAILVESIKGIQKKFPGWCKQQKIKGGISAYNGGLGNVKTYAGMDIGTPGNDYANDVTARAQWFKKNGF